MPSLLFPLFTSPSFPLEVGPLIATTGSGDCLKGHFTHMKQFCKIAEIETLINITYIFRFSMPNRCFCVLILQVLMKKNCQSNGRSHISKFITFIYVEELDVTSEVWQTVFVVDNYDCRLF